MRVAMTKRETLDWLTKFLGAFVTLAVVWVGLDSAANVVDPLGLFSFFAGLALLAALIALLGIVIAASKILRG